jgi:hypothetical protein
MGKKLVLNEAETAVTITEATIGDIFTTTIDGNAAVTGMHKFGQLALAAAAGAMVQNYRLRDSVQFWAPR